MCDINGGGYLSRGEQKSRNNPVRRDLCKIGWCSRPTHTIVVTHSQIKCTTATPRSLSCSCHPTSHRIKTYWTCARRALRCWNLALICHHPRRADIIIGRVSPTPHPTHRSLVSLRSLSRSCIGLPLGLCLMSSFTVCGFFGIGSGRHETWTLSITYDSSFARSDGTSPPIHI